jgi:plastocyanin
MIGRAAVAIGIALIAAAAPVAASAGGGTLRRHRLILPTPPLPHNLTVDESEWQIIPSERVVAAGTVTMQVYDRGQDEHNLTVQGPITSSGDGKIRGQVWLQSGGTTTLVAKLAPGRYKLYCSMFMGTPQSHEALGMLSSITVR